MTTPKKRKRKYSFKAWTIQRGNYLYESMIRRNRQQLIDEMNSSTLIPLGSTYEIIRVRVEEI